MAVFMEFSSCDPKRNMDALLSLEWKGTDSYEILSKAQKLQSLRGVSIWKNVFPDVML